MKNNSKNKINWKKMLGVIPTIVQDARTKRVLMLAYSDKESLRKALSTKQGWYYSRARKRLWRKGETSGNNQALQSAFLDCDADALLFVVKQKRNVCHTGKKSCFFRRLEE